MARLTIAGLLPILAIFGCTLVPCLDAQFPRRVRQIETPFEVRLRFEDTTLEKSVRCEEYYDAMCAERGNFWSVREVGLRSGYQTSKFQIDDEKLGQIVVPTPSCEEMTAGSIDLKNIVPRLNGIPYWLAKSAGTQRTYSNRDAQFEVLLDLQVNGVSVE